MRVKKPEFIISVILILFTVFFLYQTSIIVAAEVPNELGPKFFPYVCLTAMAVLSVLLLLSSFKGERRERAESETENKKEGETEEYPIKEALVFLFLILVSIVAIYAFGFFAGMTLGIAVILRFIGWKTSKALLFAVLSVAAVTFVFQTLIGIPMYKGLLLKYLRL